VQPMVSHDPMAFLAAPGLLFAAIGPLDYFNL
jgi:hypothetical protein